MRNAADALQERKNRTRGRGSFLVDMQACTTTSTIPLRARTRKSIVLLCGETARPLVEEIARNLRGLGFSVRIMGGIGSNVDDAAPPSTPVLYVLCPRGRPTDAQLTALSKLVESSGREGDDVYIAPIDVALPLRVVSVLGKRASGSHCVPIRRRWRESYVSARDPEAPTSRFPSLRSLPNPDDRVKTRAWKSTAQSGVPLHVPSHEDAAATLHTSTTLRAPAYTEPQAVPEPAPTTRPARVRGRGVLALCALLTIGTTIGSVAFALA